MRTAETRCWLPHPWRFVLAGKVVITYRADNILTCRLYDKYKGCTADNLVPSWKYQVVTPEVEYNYIKYTCSDELRGLVSGIWGLLHSGVKELGCEAGC